MRTALISTLALVVGLAATVPSTAAPRNGKGDYARAIDQKLTRAHARAHCTSRADEMMYGARMIQRRNFLKDCMMEQGFR